MEQICAKYCSFKVWERFSGGLTAAPRSTFAGVGEPRGTSDRGPANVDNMLKGGSGSLPVNVGTCCSWMAPVTVGTTGGTFWESLTSLHTGVTGGLGAASGDSWLPIIVPQA